MNFMELAKARYSVRKFAATPVEPEKLNIVLEAARLAPSAKNLQPVHIYVVQSQEEMEKMRELTPCHYGAPMVLIFAKNTQEEWRHPQEDLRSGAEDVAIAVTHAMLAATDVGLGSCWVKFFVPQDVARAYNLPAHIVPVALLPLGYAAADAAPADRHTQRKDLKELVTYL